MAAMPSRALSWSLGVSSSPSDDECVAVPADIFSCLDVDNAARSGVRCLDEDTFEDGGCCDGIFLVGVVNSVVAVERRRRGRCWRGPPWFSTSESLPSSESELPFKKFWRRLRPGVPRTAAGLLLGLVLEANERPPNATTLDVVVVLGDVRTLADRDTAALDVRLEVAVLWFVDERVERAVVDDAVAAALLERRRGGLVIFEGIELKQPWNVVTLVNKPTKNAETNVNTDFAIQPPTTTPSH